MEMLCLCEVGHLEETRDGFETVISPQRNVQFVFGKGVLSHFKHKESLKIKVEKTKDFGTKHFKTTNDNLKTWLFLTYTYPSGVPPNLFCQKNVEYQFIIQNREIKSNKHVVEPLK